MKKLPALFAVLLFVAPLATAATLWVQNRTQKTIVVEIVKGLGFRKRQPYKKSIEPGKWKRFYSYHELRGPMVVQFQDPSPRFYSFINELKGIFPMYEIALNGIQIKKDEKTGKPMYRQTWPKNKWLRNHPWELLYRPQVPSVLFQYSPWLFYHRRSRG